ncbi:MAG TPA: hypothetical protein VFK40_01080 [Nitrososphaeraceae archaeon]|nr:hypothetical protein [Nitrososphaeraceae archaeon]
MPTEKNMLKKIFFAVMAFAFFTFYLFFEAGEFFLPILTTLPIIDVVAAAVTTVVLFFFFLSIIKKY